MTIRIGRSTAPPVIDQANVPKRDSPARRVGATRVNSSLDVPRRWPLPGISLTVTQPEKSRSELIAIAKTAFGFCISSPDPNRNIAQATRALSRAMITLSQDQRVEVLDILLAQLGTRPREDGPLVMSRFRDIVGTFLHEGAQKDRLNKAAGMGESPGRRALSETPIEQNMGNPTQAERFGLLETSPDVLHLLPSDMPAGAMDGFRRQVESLADAGDEKARLILSSRRDTSSEARGHPEQR